MTLNLERRTACQDQAAIKRPKDPRRSLPRVPRCHQTSRRMKLSATAQSTCCKCTAGSPVLPLTMEDNSAFRPHHLTIPLVSAYPSFKELSMLFILSDEDRMTFPCVLVLAFVLSHGLPAVALSPVCASSWPCPLASRGGTPHGPPSPQATHPT